MSLWYKNMPFGASKEDCEFISLGCHDMFKNCDTCKHNKHNIIRNQKSYYERNSEIEFKEQTNHTSEYLSLYNGEATTKYSASKITDIHLFKEYKLYELCGYTYDDIEKILRINLPDESVIYISYDYIERGVCY